MDAALIARIGADLTDLRSKMDEGKGIIGGFSEKVNALSGTIAAAFSVGAIVAFGKAAITAAGEAVDGENRLLVALKGREDIQKRLLNQADQIHNTTLFEDDAIIKQQGLLAVMGRTEAQINKIISAAVQLSAATGAELSVSVEALNKTYEGQERALKALDPTLHGFTQTQLESGEVIDIVRQKYEGFAEKLTEIGSGPVMEFHKLIGDITEDVGRAILPSVNEGLQGMSDVLKAFTSDDISVLAKIAAFMGYAVTGGGSVDDLIDYNKQLQETKRLLEAGGFVGPMPAGPMGSLGPFGPDPRKAKGKGKKGPGPAGVAGGDDFSGVMPGSVDFAVVGEAEIEFYRMMLEEKIEADKSYTEQLNEEYLKRSEAFIAAEEEKARSAEKTGQMIGASIGQAISGQKSFESAVLQSSKVIIKSYYEQAIAGLAKNAFANSPPWVAPLLIAAGLAAIDGIFGSLSSGGGGGSSSAGGGGSSRRENSSLLNGNTQTVHVEGKAVINGKVLEIIFGRQAEYNSYTQPAFVPIGG